MLGKITVVCSRCRVILATVYENVYTAAGEDRKIVIEPHECYAAQHHARADEAVVCPKCGYLANHPVCTRCGTPIPASQVA